MKALATLFLSILFFAFIFSVDARARRTDNTAFSFKSGVNICNRNLSNFATSDNSHTCTFNSDADCSGTPKTSVNRAFISVSTTTLPTITLQAYKDKSDAAPQFTASLVFINLFEYTKNASSAVPDFDPNLDTIKPGSIQPFYNATNLTQNYFTVPFMSSSAISGAPAGKSVTTFTFNSINALIQTVDCKFFVDVSSTPALYGDVQLNPNTVKVTIDIENYSFMNNPKNFGLLAYLIVSKPVGSRNTNSFGRVSVPIQTDVNDKTGGTFSWDSQFFDSSSSATPNLINMYSTPFSVDPSPPIPQAIAGTAQRIYYSFNSTVSPISVIWDASVEYLDVGAASGLQIGFVALFATFAAIITILF